MSKDALYCSHDSNARNDEKIIALRMKHDWKGYGLYWAIVEKLREGTCYKLSTDYNLLAFDLRTDAGLIKSIINDFGLFSFSDNGECFYSESLCKRMAIKDAKSDKAAESANARWEREKAKNDANAMRTHNDGNANKGNKGKESNTIPPGVADQFILDFNSLKGGKFKLTDKVSKSLKARLKEGYCPADLVAAARNCMQDKYHIENPHFLTPEFILRPDKLEKYANATAKQEAPKDIFPV